MVNYLKHLFIPHHSNHHRAKILHHKIIAIFIIALLGLLFIFNSLQSQFPSILGISVNITVQELLDLTNKERIEAGLAPLRLDSSLNKAASQKASYMFEKNFWAHVAPDGTTPWYFIRNSGYEYQYAGENLARGFDSAQEVVNAWMESPTHRDNLLSQNYTDIGFAIGAGSLTGSETILIVQQFGSRYLAEGEASSVGFESGQIDLETNIVNAPLIGSISGQSSDGGHDRLVSAAVNNPLIDVKPTTFNFSILLIGLFVIIFIFDLYLIERRKLRQLFSHNLDHIVYFVIVLIAVIIISGGTTL